MIVKEFLYYYGTYIDLWWLANILRCEGSLEWLVCLRSPATSLKSSCGTELIKYAGDVDFSIGLDEKHVCVGLEKNMHVLALTKNMYVLVLTKNMFAKNQPGLGPGDGQDGEDMAGCPNTPEPPRGAPDPQEDSLDILWSPPGGGRSANPHCRRISPVFRSQRRDRWDRGSVGGT